MAEVILMPRLSDTMTEGVIASWHKKVGDRVKKGDLLAEVETDKATMELESYKDGVLLHLGGDKGSKIQVNDLLAIIGNEGEDISSLLNQPAQTSTATPTPAATPAPSNPAPATTAPTMDLSKMEEVVLMPRLSDTMEEGVIAGWHKNVGEAVKKGEVLADIETDKATMELESYKNGTLLYIGAQKGEKIPVNGLLCIIGEKGKVDVDAIVAAAKSGHTAAVATTTQAALAPVVQSTVATSPATVSATVVDANGRIKASPLQKKWQKIKALTLAKY